MDQAKDRASYAKKVRVALRPHKSDEFPDDSEEQETRDDALCQKDGLATIHPRELDNANICFSASFENANANPNDDSLVERPDNTHHART